MNTEISEISEIRKVKATLDEVIRTLMLNEKYQNQKFYLIFEDFEDKKRVEKAVPLNLELFLRWGDMPVLKYRIVPVADTATIYIYIVNWFQRVK